ncbi:MAG: hypothetical protein GC172_09235 [Phycisphaera sp.]|nr:hypothetical protein [Phycisphaera sp.]
MSGAHAGGSLARRATDVGGRTACVLAARVVLAALAPLVAAAPARGDLVGTISPGAAGDGHLWWSVERIAPAVPGVSAEGQAPEHLLMHHASVEPAPTERFVMRLAAAPEAMAADGARVALITRAEGGRRRGVLLLATRRNEASGHWFTAQRGAPRVLAPLAEGGAIEATALVGESLFVLGSVREALDAPSDAETPRTLLAVGLSGPEAAAWRAVKPPPAPVDARVHLFDDDGALGAVWREADRLVLARRPASLGTASEPWSTESFPGSGESELLGAFTIEGRRAAVERARADGAAPTGIRVGFLRAGRIEPWAEFPEPAGLWSLAPFGADAVLLALDDRGRGSTRRLPTRAAAPEDGVALEPPGFSSGRWVHLPILGALSVAFALAALMFGSDAYLQSRDGGGKRSGRPLRLVGAPLSRRFLAFAIDALPAFFLAVLLLGGNPLRFLDIPILTPNFDAAWPSAVVALAGWLAAAVGDIAVGRSFGKRIMGLVIVARDGTRPTRGRLALRAALSLVPVLSPLVMLLALVNPWRDGPAEMLSGTVVAEEGREAATQEETDRSSGD